MLMTAWELITLLNKLPPDARIMLPNPRGGFQDIETVRPVYDVKDAFLIVPAYKP